MEYSGNRRIHSDQDQLQVIIKVTAPDGRHDSLIGAIKALLGSIRARAGCIDCHEYQDTENPEDMALLQEWESENAFADHVGSRDYRYILEWMEMSASVPEVTVCRGLEHRGFDVIRRLMQVNA
ncbi:MAG: putative quinol monooxygenase [Gammaproteobacteria bacterium]